MSQPHVIIIGAGITGLTTAIAARRAGADVTILERAAEIQPMGAAISLWWNALWCLDDLGLGPAVRAAGSPITRVTARHPDGKAVMDLPLDGLLSDADADNLCITRADLQSALLANLNGADLKLGQSVEQVEDIGTGVTVHLEGGDAVQGDMAVAADGLWSGTRAALLADKPPRSVGYGAVLGLAQPGAPLPEWFAPGEACEMHGPNGRLGLIACGGERLYWFYVSRKIAAKPGVQPLDRVWLDERLSVWPSFAAQLPDHTPPENMPVVHFFDRPAADHWGRWNVLLAGDAAHPYAPNFGQGACQGIEDAHAIGTGLSRELTGPSLSAFYHWMRKAQADRLITENRQSGLVTQAETAVHRGLRRAVMALTPQFSLRTTFRRHLRPPVYPA